LPPVKCPKGTAKELNCRKRSAAICKSKYQKSTLQKSSRERQITAKQCSRYQSTSDTQLSKNVDFYQHRIAS